MKNMKKVLVTLVAAVLLVAVSVGATLAFLTAQSTKVTNVFTVGNVKIQLDEAVVDVYGDILDEDGKAKEWTPETLEAVAAASTRTQHTNGAGNTYKIMPGHEYIKDPTVTVEAGSEPSYVRVWVEITNYDKVVEVFGEENAKPHNFVTGWDWYIWKSDMKLVGTSALVEYRYCEKIDNGDGTFSAKDKIVDARTAAQTLDPLFLTFKVPTDVNSNNIEKLNGVKINVWAQAIQADGFDSAAEAWKSFDGQHGVTNGATSK